MSKLMRERRHPCDRDRHPGSRRYPIPIWHCL